MRKNLYLILLAVLPMCFAACGSDDEEENESDTIGLTTSNLIGDWIIIKSYNTITERGDQDVGIIWSFNSDGSWKSTAPTWRWDYVSWSIMDGKIQMKRPNGNVEAYTAEIKDGLLYTRLDHGSKVFERVQLSESNNITSDYFVGTWEASGGSAYGTWIFNSDGSCNFSHYSAGKNYSTDGKWTYTPSTQTLSTTVTNWEWKITKATTDEWTGGNGQSYKRVK